MKRDYNQDNILFLACLALIMQFVIKSLNDPIISQVDFVLLFWIANLDRMKSFQSLSSVIVMFFLSDLVTYRMIGLSSMVFFVSYVVVGLFEKFLPFIIKGFSLSAKIIFVCIYFVINGLVTQNLNFGVVVINLLVLLVFSLLQAQFKRDNGLRKI
jgi:hypothetical protein